VSRDENNIVANDVFINKIGIKCSNGKVFDPVGGPGERQIEVTSPVGFNRLDLTHNRWNVASLRFKNNDTLIGKTFGGYSPTYPSLNTQCDRYGKIVGIHGDYIDVYKRFGVTCRY